MLLRDEDVSWPRWTAALGTSISARGRRGRRSEQSPLGSERFQKQQAENCPRKVNIFFHFAKPEAFHISEDS